MFVLRSHEPASGTIPVSGRGPVPATTDERQHARHEGKGLTPPWRDRVQDQPAAPNLGACRSSPTEARLGERCQAAVHMPLFAAAFAVRFGGAIARLECPKHFADVQALIDKVATGLGRARERMPWDGVALVDALLDDARMLLEAARQNHQQSRGPYDHARAFAKADAALGHVRAAEIVYSRCTQK